MINNTDFFQELYTPSHYSISTSKQQTKLPENMNALEKTIRNRVSSPENGCHDHTRLTVKELLMELGFQTTKKNLNDAARILRELDVKTIKTNGIVKRILILI